MWSFNLAKQLAEDNINVIAVNPGALLNIKMVAEATGNIGHWLIKASPKATFANAHVDAYDEQKSAELLAVTERLLA